MILLGYREGNSFSACMKLKGLIGLKRQSKRTPHCLLILLRHFPGRGESCLLFLVLCCVSVKIEVSTPGNCFFPQKLVCYLLATGQKDERTFHLFLEGKVSALFEGFAELPHLTDSAPPASCLQEYQIL